MSVILLVLIVSRINLWWCSFYTVIEADNNAGFDINTPAADAYVDNAGAMIVATITVAADTVYCHFWC